MKNILVSLVVWLHVSSLFAGEQLPGQKVTLAWNKNPEPDVHLYRLYWGFEGPRNYSFSIDTPATEVGVSLPRPGLTYRFAVIAIADSGLESDMSEEVVYVSPVPAPPPVGFKPGFLVWPRNPQFSDALETCTDLSLQDWTPVPIDSVYLDLETGQWTFPFVPNLAEPMRFFRIRRTVAQ